MTVESLGIESSNPARYSPQNLAADVESCLNANDPLEIAQNVLRTVVDAVREHPDFLPESVCQPILEKYARRPLHIDPLGRFSIFAMTWGKGQSTPLHDHGGLWVAEVLYRGKVAVTDYTYLGELQGLHQFREDETTVAGPGQSSYRVPPDEHHILANAVETPSVTIHVFGGVLGQCNSYFPVEGGYQRSTLRMRSDS